MTESVPDVPRLWVEFPDPDEWDPETEHPHTIIRADLTWLTSSWTCIFGQGCQGIDAAHPEVGCCRLGAHFSDKEDENRVRDYVNTLTPTLWQRHPGREIKRKDWITKDEDGARKTKVVDGGCIFANDPGFPGGSGCALHHLSSHIGVPHAHVKPDVCWQLPIRRSYRTVTRPDDTEYLELTLAEYDRRGWGTGGEDLDWYCTGAPEAHIGKDPVYLGMRDELIEMIGLPAYQVLAEHCAQVKAHHGLLPLTVHPATAVSAAQ